MHLKIRCDGESRKFFSFWVEVNRAKVHYFKKKNFVCNILSFYKEKRSSTILHQFCAVSSVLGVANRLVATRWVEVAERGCRPSDPHRAAEGASGVGRVVPWLWGRVAWAPRPPSQLQPHAGLGSRAPREVRWLAARGPTGPQSWSSFLFLFLFFFFSSPRLPFSPVPHGGTPYFP